MRRILLGLVLVGAASPADVILRWEDLRNPTGTTYSVYRASGTCGLNKTGFTLVSAGVQTKTYTDLARPIGVWCYVVTATSGGLESKPSNQVEVTVYTTPPDGLTGEVR